jgi:hypothetical protein
MGMVFGVGTKILWMAIPFLVMPHDYRDIHSCSVQALTGFKDMFAF